MKKTFSVALMLFSALGTARLASAQYPTPVPAVPDNPKLPSDTILLTPLQTELVGSLDISRVHPGSPVLVKLDVPWTGTGCKLRANSILTGHVAEVDPRTKQNRVSRVTVLFDTADCNGAHSTPFPTTLVAVLAGTVGGDPDLVEGPPLADAVGLSIAGGLRGALTASATTNYTPLPVRKLPSQVLPGQVVGLSWIRLSVASGMGGGSILAAPNHDLRLESTTHFVLMPRFDLPATATAAAGSSDGHGPSAAAPTTVATPEPEPVDETDICTAACSTVASADLPVSTTKEGTSLSLSVLGYSPREKREVISFGYDASLTYLDAQNLLFTFDLHKLRERKGDSLQESMRTVRAVLIDPSSQQVKRMLDWRVQGEGRYIWRVGQDKLMVHVGNQLRLFGPDLNPIRSASVPGTLAWISAAPSGNRFAVGIYRERHTPEVHRELFEAIGGEPTEDIDLQVYDGDLKLLLTVPRSSESYPPILSDLGEIRVRSIGHTHWQISEYRWDRTEHTIAHTNSNCRPWISTAPSGYIFMIGCGSVPGARWYRMLRPDGHPVLKAFSPSEDIEQAFSSVDPSEFAVRVVKIVRPVTSGQTFGKSDIGREEISVYRYADGHRLFSTAVAEVPMIEQSFALSPNGNQLALVGEDSINFYSIEPKAALNPIATH